MDPWRKRTRLYFGGVAVAVGLTLVWPASAGMALLFLMPVVQLAVIQSGVRTHRPSSAAFWRCMQAAFAILIVSSLLTVLDLMRGTPESLLTNASYFLGYPVIIAGLVVLLRQRTRGLGPIGLIDAAILTGGLAVLVWTFVIEPIVDDVKVEAARRIILAAYPFGDLVMFGMLVALTGDGGRRPRAYKLMMAAIGLEFGADLVNAMFDGAFTMKPGIIPAIWVVAYTLFGGAALDPSMTEMSMPDRRSWRSGPLRLGALGASALVAPAVLGVGTALGRDVDIAMIVTAGIAIPMLLMARTLLERSRAESALREVYRQTAALHALEELNATKDRILTAVSHELRTPLTTVVGLSHTLHRRGEELDPKMRTDLSGRLATQAGRLVEVMSSLLDVAALRSGTFTLARAPTDVGGLVRGVVDRDAIRQGRLVHVSAPSLVAKVDGAMTERILRILLSNAGKHTPDGTPVWVSVRSAPEGVVLAVEDCGPGVASGMRDSIFGEFVHGPDVASHAPGLGMGLAVVRHLANAHGGAAWVEERPGGGASFRVLLPPPSGGKLRDEIIEEPSVRVPRAAAGQAVRLLG